MRHLFIYIRTKTKEIGAQRGSGESLMMPICTYVWGASEGDPGFDTSVLTYYCALLYSVRKMSLVLRGLYCGFVIGILCHDTPDID